jgi:hypothetical protein
MSIDTRVAAESRNEGLTSLAVRVEAASGLDRELDALIGCAVAGFYLADPRYPGATQMYGYVDAEGGRVEPGNGAPDRLIPAYTASLDAAMTLAGGKDVRLNIASDGIATAWVGGTTATGTTPPLALTAAALRARAATA